MTVSIANMAQVWMSNTNTYNAISMSVSTLGYGADSNSSLLKFNVDGNTVFRLDAKGTTTSKTSNVANLGPATTMGSRSFVTDANNYTFGSIAYAGGSNAVPVFSNGTYWLIG